MSLASQRTSWPERTHLPSYQETPPEMQNALCLSCLLLSSPVLFSSSSLISCTTCSDVGNCPSPEGRPMGTEWTTSRSCASLAIHHQKALSSETGRGPPSFLFLACPGGKLDTLLECAESERRKNQEEEGRKKKKKKKKNSRRHLPPFFVVFFFGVAVIHLFPSHSEGMPAGSFCWDVPSARHFPPVWLGLARKGREDGKEL